MSHHLYITLSVLLYLGVGAIGIHAIYKHRIDELKHIAEQQKAEILRLRSELGLRK